MSPPDVSIEEKFEEWLKRELDGSFLCGKPHREWLKPETVEQMQRDFKRPFTVGYSLALEEIEKLKESNEKIRLENLALAPLYSKRLLMEQNQKLRESLENFLKKTTIYLQIYESDKELRKYREDAKKILNLDNQDRGAEG